MVTTQDSLSNHYPHCRGLMHSFEQISHKAAFVASLVKSEDFFLIFNVYLQTFMITVIPIREGNGHSIKLTLGCIELIFF